MKKHNRNPSFHTSSHRLPIHRETVRIITGQDLALVAAGAVESTTILTEKPTTTTHGLC